jgi:hypothetical protein
VAGRSRTCGAPRFRRALYRAELRPREHASVTPGAMPSDVVHATRLPFDPGSRAADRATGEHTSYVEGRWSPSRGVGEEIRRRKQTLTRAWHSSATPRVFLSQAGPRFDLGLLKLSITLSVPTRDGRLPVRKRRPVGRPRLASLCDEWPSAQGSQRGLERRRRGALRRPRAWTAAIRRRASIRRGRVGYWLWSAWQR